MEIKNPEDRYYILDKDNVAIRCDMITWARYFESNATNIRVMRDELMGMTISTVFLGIDHSYDPKDIHIFETMVFDKTGESIDMDRCGTWNEAVTMHHMMLERVKTGKIGK